MRRLLNLVCNSSLKTFLTGELSWDHIAVLISNEQKFPRFIRHQTPEYNNINIITLYRGTLSRKS